MRFSNLRGLFLFKKGQYFPFPARKQLKIVRTQFFTLQILRSMSLKNDNNKRSNELMRERSPYLLQHANNPVHWLPWGEKAFQRARDENKLIFLSIGYSTCHWCHVMERESFENETIAAYMNEHFVNIKVDREERPDVDNIYVTFVQMTQHHAGWPLSVFLTPDLKPIYGGTYYPPEDKWGHPGFKTILEKIANKWKEDPASMKGIGDRVIISLQRATSFDMVAEGRLPFAVETLPGDEICGRCCEKFEESFDGCDGGFHLAPKFPQPSVLDFLFLAHASQPNSGQGMRALNMVLRTLKAMSCGGIYDHIGYGFARYSVDNEWHVPHFEKMLYVQAQLAVSYATAYALTKSEEYVKIAKGILTYVQRDLSHLEGGFYAGEDADSATTDGNESKEGAFYVWTMEEIEEILKEGAKYADGATRSDIFSHFYNVEKGGNVPREYDTHEELKGKNILVIKAGGVERTCEKFGMTERQLEEELEICRLKLTEVRNRRSRPFLDTKIIAAWNGLMISGFAKTAQFTADESYANRATKAAEFLEKFLWRDGRLLHCCYIDEKDGGVVQIENPVAGMVKDYAFLIRGLLDLYECDFNCKWLEWAERLQDIQNEEFWTPNRKGYFNTSPHLTLQLKDDSSGAEPSGDAISAQNLLRLSAMLDRTDYGDLAEDILAANADSLCQYPYANPDLVCAFLMRIKPNTQIIITGRKEEEDAKAMLNCANSFYIPNRVLMLVDDSADAGVLSKSEAIKSIKAAKDGSVCKAYVCRNRACMLPVYQLEKLRDILEKAVEEGWANDPFFK